MLRLWLRKNLLRSFRLTREMLHASLQANFSLTIEIHIVIKKTFTKNRFREKLCSWKKRIQSKYFTGSRILQSSLHCFFSYLSVQPFRIIFITIKVWVNRNDEEKCFRIRRHSFKRKLPHEWKSVSPTFCYKGWILGNVVSTSSPSFMIKNSLWKNNSHRTADDEAFDVTMLGNF